MKPKVEVIIPVGPGHEDSALQAILSAEKMGFGVIVVDDTEGKMGRSEARNKGVEIAQAPWIFFLDADDVMHRNCKKAFPYMQNYDAIWGLINVEGRVRVPQVRNVTFHDLVNQDPYRTLQMGHFIRRDLAARHPFNDLYDTGEDFEYYFRVWSDPDICAIKIPHSLFVNQRGNHSKGPRSATGKAWVASVESQQDLWRWRMGGGNLAGYS